MTPQERVRCALHHQETDIVPYQIDLTGQAAERLATYTGERDFLHGTGMHLQYIQYWGWPTETGEGTALFKDDFGVCWNRSGADKDIGVVDHPLLTEPDLSLLPEPYLNAARLRSEVEQMLASAEDRYVFAGIGFSLFERLWSYCGMENALVYMLTEPEFTHELLDRIRDFNLQVIDILNEYPLDAVYFGDDWGQQKGLIMGPELWRTFIKPRMAALYDRARQGGKRIIQHSCGDIHEIFPDLIDIGLDCYQTFQPEIYDVDDVKREFGRDLTFWGGLSTQRLLPYASPEEVKAETRRMMERMGKGGGYIAAPTHAVPGDVPPENILAMLDVFQNQRG